MGDIQCHTRYKMTRNRMIRVIRTGRINTTDAVLDESIIQVRQTFHGSKKKGKEERKGDKENCWCQLEHCLCCGRHWLTPGAVIPWLSPRSVGLPEGLGAA
jgi:hypothetical protein